MSRPEERITASDIPERLGTEKYERLMEDLQVTDPTIYLQEYSQKGPALREALDEVIEEMIEGEEKKGTEEYSRWEQAKIEKLDEYVEKLDEYVRWLLLLAPTGEFNEHRDIIVEYLLNEYEIDVKAHGGVNESTILGYISGQLRTKARTRLFEKGNMELLREGAYKDTH